MLLTSYCEDFATNFRFYLFVMLFVKGKADGVGEKEWSSGYETWQKLTDTTVFCMLGTAAASLRSA